MIVGSREHRLVRMRDLDLAPADARASSAHPSRTTSERGLVVAQAEEARVAQTAVAGPLGEPDLGDELRLDPGHAALADRCRVRERRRPVRASSRSSLAEVAQRVVVEPGPDLARVPQAAVVVVAEQQRPELDPRAARRREAADHELLALLALELQPVARARGRVRAVGALGDQPLPALAARLLEERLAVARCDVASSGSGPRNCSAPRSSRLRVAQRQPATSTRRATARRTRNRTPARSGGRAARAGRSSSPNRRTRRPRRRSRTARTLSAESASAISG